MVHHLSLLSLKGLESYCIRREFKGWDPYDGLNSKIFQSISLFREWDLARLAWIQFFKRNPLNLRELFQIPVGYNPKGLALFILGYCNMYRYTHITGEERFGPESDIKEIIVFLSDLLLSLILEGYSGACWGYNFDWQARRLFLFPKGTPTVVVTAFCTEALIEAYRITDRQEYLKTALTAADFVLNDLHRTVKDEGFLFSYSPLNGNNTVYNASLLGTKILSLCYRHSKDRRFLIAAHESACACSLAQNYDGSWYYGELAVQKWIDSFHTGYNLESLIIFSSMTGDKSFEGVISRGFKFYLENFFLSDGTPKYYHNRTFPVDIHSPAQLLITLCRSGRLVENKVVAERVIRWTIKNMQDNSGYFYYQRSKFHTNKIPYMRWSNAFMFNALSLYILHSASL